MHEKEGNVSPWEYDIPVCFVKDIDQGKTQTSVRICGLKERQPFLPTVSLCIAETVMQPRKNRMRQKSLSNYACLKWILLVTQVY